MTAKKSAFEPFGRVNQQTPPPRMCEVEGCTHAGEYRAPRDRRLSDYMWLCLDHVREFNKRWNFYEGMSAEEVEAEIRRDTCWQRPSWKLGALGARPRPAADFNDPFDMFADQKEDARRRAGARDGGEDKRTRRRLESEEEKALRVMDLDVPFTKETLKARYKALVKIHHPDVNMGDKLAEERLKDINQAYKTLLGSLNA